MSDIKPTAWEVSEALMRAAVAIQALASIVRDHGNKPVDEKTMQRMQKHTEPAGKAGKMFGRWVSQQPITGHHHLSSFLDPQDGQI